MVTPIAQMRIVPSAQFIAPLPSAVPFRSPLIAGAMSRAPQVMLNPKWLSSRYLDAFS